MADAGKPDHITNSTELWARLRLKHYEANVDAVKNANDIHDKQLSLLDRFAVKITDKVGSMGFFILILAWTVLWCGYNILASDVPSLHWQAFDPFPAFVAYLLISNVIQILLMPLIMVGQNLQGRHSEIRAQLDYEVNTKAEQEVMVILRNLEHNTDLLIQLIKLSGCPVSEGEFQAITAEKALADKVHLETQGQDIERLG